MGEKTYQGKCFCGAVKFKVTGDPAAGIRKQGCFQVCNRNEFF